MYALSDLQKFTASRMQLDTQVNENKTVKEVATLTGSHLVCLCVVFVGVGQAGGRRSGVQDGGAGASETRVVRGNTDCQ